MEINHFFTLQKNKKNEFHEKRPVTTECFTFGHYKNKKHPMKTESEFLELSN